MVRVIEGRIIQKWSEGKQKLLLLIAVVAAFVVASESAVINTDGCPKCHKKDASRTCREIFGCTRKREFLKKFYQLLQDKKVPRNNMEYFEDFIPEDD